MRPRKAASADLTALARLEAAIPACARCPRLRAYCREVARVRKPEFRDQTYWGRPVPGAGDPGARLLIVGLAPAAHGANRTGRMFTGDSSGDWLYEALYRYGFADQPRSVSRDDDLQLIGCFITAAARCAPPGNQPTIGEMDACQSWMERELELLRKCGWCWSSAASPGSVGSGPAAGGGTSLQPNAPRSGMAGNTGFLMGRRCSPHFIPAGRTPIPGS